MDSSSKVLAKNIDAVKRAREAGIATIAATARSARSTARISKEGGLGPIAVCANGAVGFDLVANEILWHDVIPAPLALGIVEGLRGKAPGILCALEYHTEFIPEYGFLRQETVIDRFEPVSDIVGRLTNGATKIICRHPEFAQQELKGMIEAIGGDEISTSPGSIDWMEILPRGTSKASGLIRACEWFGFKMSSVAVIGDHLNDLPMIKVAATSAAVANGHRETRAAATITVPSNDDSGVASYLDRLISAQARG